MIDKLAWICIKDRKVLGTVSKGKDKFYIPGGKRENYENDIEALIREIKEELTVDLDIPTIRYYGAFKAQADGKPEGTLVKTSCYMSDYNGEIKPDSEIDRILWMTSKDMNGASTVVQQILNDLIERDLID